MKKLILYIYLSLSSFFVNAQEKSGDTWLLGLIGDINILKWESKDSITTKYINDKETYAAFDDPNASICDQHGNLKFYSSGCSIIGNNYKIIPNGIQINPNSIHDEYCGKQSYGIYPAYNNGVFLPKPEDSTKYYLFHTSRDTNDLEQVLFPFYKFYFTIIDDTNSKAKVIKKNILLVKDTLSEMGPLACRHANGRDWWVLVPTIGEHSFYRALLTKDSVTFIGHQILAAKFGKTQADYQGQAVFSPDGSKYIRSDPFNGTYIYDFDRCTGLMSNPIFIDNLIKTSCAGVAVSQNSRYLYISNRVVLHQFDLWASSIITSKIKIGVYDGHITPLGTANSFYKMALAPDGKIYMGATNTTESLHVIHNPDAKGDSCNFKQHDYFLPSYFYVGLPNYPNFRLGAKAVICPTVSATEEIKTLVFAAKLFPNPAKEKVVLTWETYLEQNATWELYNQYGQLVFKNSIELSTQEAQIDISSVENGIYFWKLNVKGRIGQSGKLVILR